MAKRYSKAAHSKRRKQTSHVLKNTVILLFCAVGIWFGSSLWHAALTLQTAQPAESIAGEEFRPQVGDPPYRVVIDAGHGGADPGARGVIEEKDMTAATASELIRLLQQDSNFIPLQTRDSFDETTTPAQRAARADEQAPQLLLSIHGNSAAAVPPERTNRHRSCCFPSTATQLQMAPLHPALSAIRQCRAGLGIRKAFTLRSCLPKECRLQEHLCVGAGESDTFIIWKTIRSNWWKAPTPRCAQSEALRCWKM